MSTSQKSYKFRGGVKTRVFTGSLKGSTWPNGILKINEDKIILEDHMFKTVIEYPREQIERIEVRKIIPIIGHGIRIHSKNKNDTSDFWYVSWRLNKLLDALRDCNYL